MTVRRTSIVYFGTPQVAVAPLRALHVAGYEIALVMTRPPRRRSRRASPTPSPVAEAATELGLEVSWEPADAASVDADLGVVVAYGEFIEDDVLSARRTVNLHFSLLPCWRGPAPVERAILAGDTESGVCLMEVASELDTGAVYRLSRTPIAPHETAEQLRARLCDMGIDLLLGALAEGFGTPQSQSGTPTWADKISPADLRIDWTAPAGHVMRQVRVGGAWTTFRSTRLKVLAAAIPSPVSLPDDAADLSPVGGSSLDAVPTHAAPGAITMGRGIGGGDAVPTDAAPGTITMGRGIGSRDAVLAAAGDASVELQIVQAEGRQATTAQQWRNGARLAAGERLD